MLTFSTLEYTVEGLRFYYNDAQPSVFYTAATVKFPKKVFSSALGLGLPLKDALGYVERKDAGMAKYVRKVIEGFADKPTPELLAFDSLEEDGFDLKQFMVYAFSELQLDIEPM